MDANPAAALLALDAAFHLVPDFPQPGILFRDMSPLLADHFTTLITALQQALPAPEWAEIDAVVGIEARGFVLAAALAQATGKGLLLVRKADKLPPPVHQCRYALEYGEDVLEMSATASTRRILLVDDVLATGGTLTAAGQLCRQAGHTVTGALVLINLTALNNYRCNDRPAISLWCK